MRARDAFAQAQQRLQAAGCRYRIKEVARSPYVQDYEAHHPRRQQSARGYRCDDAYACWDLVELLLRADQKAAQGGTGLDWDALNVAATAWGSSHRLITWGELRTTVRGGSHPGDLPPWTRRLRLQAPQRKAPATPRPSPELLSFTATNGARESQFPTSLTCSLSVPWCGRTAARRTRRSPALCMMRLRTPARPKTRSPCATEARWPRSLRPAPTPWAQCPQVERRNDGSPARPATSSTLAGSRRPPGL